MSRDVPIGNGAVLIAFDRDALIREFHFPHVGQENHAGDPFRLGVWVDDQFSWVPDGWQIKKDYLTDTLITQIELTHNDLGIKITSNDLVDFEQNIYLKKLTVENFRDQEREVRIFLSQDFRIYGNGIGDTAAFKPEINALLHYKGERYFLINTLANNKFGIDFFATGNTGTWKDAEDGILSGNPIAQGSVDSAIAIQLTVPPRGKDSSYYWIAIGTNWEEVSTLNTLVIKTTPQVLFNRTANFWKLWVDKEKINYDLLPPKISHLYKKSLLICRTQINNCGSIIAANDSDSIQFNRDTYSYMWPRDGALVAYAMDLAGYESTNFFRFCAKIIEKEGFFLHKYLPSGSLGSSWHPWMKDDKPQLPIQEDETALIIWALWNHFKLYKDLEFIRPLYRPLIKKAANFMLEYRDYKTGLPLPSFDLWEERQGILTFTASAVYGGLIAASYFANAFGEKDLAEEYTQAATKMRQAMDKYLYLPDEKRFARMINFTPNGIEIDKTIDASIYGTFAFGAYRPDDEKVKNTMDQIFDTLTVNGGLIRYEEDPYYREEGQPPNPWFVTTLWKAQYLIALAKSQEELQKALEILNWVADHALPSGVLAEQISSRTNEPTSVSPLTWSHGTYIATVQEYLNKLLELEQCPTCGQPKSRKTR